MLREDMDREVRAPETPTTDVMDDTSMALRQPLAALASARAALEESLQTNESWRALQQLEAREAAGDWLDVMESDILRERLTQTLAAVPDFMAWQFVDAAMACLDASARAQQLPLTADDDMLADARGSDDTVPDMAAKPMDRQGEPITADGPRNGLSTRLQPAELIAAADRHMPPMMPPVADGSRVLLPPMRALALRIPTLQPHLLSSGEAEEAEERTPAPPSTTPSVAQFAELPPLLSPVLLGPTLPPPALPVTDTRANDTSDADTRFGPHAVGAEEAEVVIVRRSSSPPDMLNRRLPPLLLTDRLVVVPPTSRGPVAKWADKPAAEPDDYRPIGSALDEAQVTIISTHEKNQAQSRAERRAMGVAPDREARMKRFLTALSGE